MKFSDCRHLVTSNYEAVWLLWRHKGWLIRPAVAEDVAEPTISLAASPIVTYAQKQETRQKKGQLIGELYIYEKSVK